MPRRTPVKEIEKEISVVNSPLRRSSRISNNSPAPIKITTRRNSASETTSSSTPKATRGRRSSFSQELESAKESDTDNKTAKVTATSRPRRGSLSSKNSEDSTEENVPKRTTRASSVTKEEPTEVKKPVTRRRRSASQEVEEEPVTKTTRKTSLTKKNEKTETKNTEENGAEPEPSLEVSTPMKKLDSIEEVTKESDSPDATTSKSGVGKKIKTDNLDLSVIKEISLTEEDTASEEDSKFSQTKLEEKLETESEDKEKTDPVVIKAEGLIEENKDFEEKNVSGVENIPLTNGEIIETPKKVENHSCAPEKSSVLENTNEVISPQGNKENISPKKKTPEPECEPMEVDEPDFESSLSKSLHTQSPVLKVSKIQEVSKELEITENVTNEIDEFLKDEVKYSPKFSNTAKKSRLSLNRSSSPRDEKKEAVQKDIAVDENGEIATEKEDKKEVADEATEKREEPVLKNIAIEENEEVTKEITGKDVSQAIAEETQLSQEKEVDSQEDSEDSFHLELTETKSLNDSGKIEDSKQDKHENTEDKESTVQEHEVIEDKDDILDKSDSEKNTEKSFNLEDTDYKVLNTSTDFITDYHIEEIAENQDTDVSIEKTEDHKDTESGEVAIEFEISKNDSVLEKGPESGKEDIEKKIDEKEDSSISLESNEITENQGLSKKEETIEVQKEQLIPKEDPVQEAEESIKEDPVEETESVANAKQEENLEKEKTQAAVKKSPVNVISDIVIQPAVVKNDPFKKISPEKSVSLEEKSPGSIEADSTQTEEDDEVFVKPPYKSPEKRVRSKSLFQQVFTDNNSSDEEEIVTKKGSTSIDEIVIVSDNENGIDEVMKYEDDDEEILVSSESETEVKESEKSKLKKSTPEKTLITMQQNFKAGDDTEKCLSDRIHKVVDLFCAGISNTKNVSVNVSLEFSGHFSDSENETTSKEGRIEESLVTSASKEDSKKPSLDKGSKRRKLYNPGYQIHYQNEEEENKITNRKKSATFNESHNSSSSPPKNPDGEELSPLKERRPYRNTPYKSGKKSPADKEESPTRKRKLSEDEAALKYLLFSSVSESNSESELDSTWGPSREVSSNDDESSSSGTASSGDASFRIISPIPGILVTGPDNNKGDDSQETSFNYSRSPKSCSSSPGNKTQSPKKRLSSENVKKAEEIEKKKGRTSTSPGKKQRKRVTSENEEDKEVEVRKSTSFGKKKRRSLTNEDKETVQEKKVEIKSTSPAKTKQSFEEEEVVEKTKQGNKSTNQTTPKNIIEKKRKKKEEKNLNITESGKKVWKKKENVFVKPSASSTVEKRAPEVIVSKVSTNKLKVSTTECGKKMSKKQGKKTKFLKPSTCGVSSDWSVKKFVIK